ncbi:alpha/beta fold hydrolase [Nocardia sp. NPDC056100]|uniref:alpha/beta fold hydrolase n=1 Tax=Nocardia sp. NPDC056100 TaxID=3345712 RepID=UPI0035D6CF3D
MVYIHGLLCDGQYWASVTEHVHERLGGNISQIVFDQRGHGRSGSPDRRSVTTLHHLVDDLDAVMAHTTGDVVLVTHSAGSLLAAAYAQHHPTRAAALSALVMFSGAGEFPEFPSLPGHYRTVITKLPRWRHTRLDGVAVVATAMAQRRFRRVSQRLGSKANLVCGTQRADSRVLTDVLGAYGNFTLDSDAAAVLRRIPTFVIAGERDRIVPPAQSVRLADKIQADYELVPGVGHSLPHAEPARAAEAVVQALDVASRRHSDLLVAAVREAAVEGSESL